MSTANERFNSAFCGALVAAAALFTTLALLVTLTNRVVVRALNVEAPDFVAVSKIRRNTQYAVDVTSETCYVMFSNVTGPSFAPVNCAAIGVDPYSVLRTDR